MGGHVWPNVFMSCSNLETIAIYVVKQACGNDIMAPLHFNAVVVFVKKTLLLFRLVLAIL